MVNKQLPEKVDRRPDGALDVIDVFPTIQGEGPFSGCPAIFVRLAGCSIRCPECDTEYTKGRTWATVSELVDAVTVCSYPVWKPFVVLTGGEPFRQNITPFVKHLTNLGYIVQIETNGTLPIDLAIVHLMAYGSVHIVCSPKTATVHGDALSFVRVWKYIIEQGQVDDDGLPLTSLGMKQRPVRPPEVVDRHNIYVQPMDTGDKLANAANVEAAVETCRRHGFRLCLQTHKMVNLP